MVLTLLLHTFDHTQTVLATFSRRFENISSDIQMGPPGVSIASVPSWCQPSSIAILIA